MHDQELSNKTILSLLDAHVALDGSREVKEVNGKSVEVLRAYKFQEDSGIRFLIKDNISALKKARQVVEDAELSFKSTYLSQDKAELGPKEGLAFTLGIAAILAQTQEIELNNLDYEDLLPGKNLIPGSVLAALDVVIIQEKGAEE